MIPSALQQLTVELYPTLHRSTNSRWWGHPQEMTCLVSSWQVTAHFHITVFIAYKKSSQFRLCHVWGCRLHRQGPGPQELPGNLHKDHLYDSAKHVISPNQKTHSLLVYGTLHRQGEAFLGMFADSGKKEVARLRISTRKRSVFLRLGENSKVTFKEFRFKHVFWNHPHKNRRSTPHSDSSPSMERTSSQSGSTFWDKKVK